MNNTRYVIEARDAEGRLLLGDHPDPVEKFGLAAVTGMDEDKMAKVIWRWNNDAVLKGDDILNWPRVLNPNWVARRKTW